MIKLYLTLLLFIYSSFSLAAIDKGNGGVGLSCKNPQSVSLLDFYEAETLYGYHLQNDMNVNHEIDLLEIILLNINKQSPEMANRLKTEFINFQLHQVMFDGELGASEDTKHVLIPKDCKTIQIALQRQNIISSEVIFIISLPVYQNLNILNRAGLILHEIIYKNSSHSDSREIRKLVGLLFSNELFNKTATDLKNDFIHAGWIF